MRPRAVVPAAALALALAAAGCGGAPVDSSRKVASFSGLEVTGGVEVHVVRGDRPGVTVHGRPDVIDRVDTESAAGRLRVGVHDRGIVIGADPMDDVRVQVTVPRLDDVTIRGHGDVDLGDVRARSLKFVVTGAGEVSTRGSVDRLDASIHGAGEADFSRLAAREARLEIHGAASMSVDVSDRLDVEIHGAGDVRYTGAPEITRDIHGPGEVLRATP